MSLHRHLAAFVFLLITKSAAIETSQTLTLSQGWNAVWLEVDPVDSSGQGQAVDVVFSNPAVVTVATPQSPYGSIEFVADTSEGFFNQSGWQVWHRSSELGANTLHVIRGYQGYLVKCSAPITFNVTGVARYSPTSWEPDNYNLVGFGLNGTATFGDLFGEAADTHPINRILRLNPTTGGWEGVRETDTMTSGEAYWIYSEGASNFNGPVRISFTGGDSLDFGSGPANATVQDPQVTTNTIMVNTEELVLTNLTDREQTVTLQKVFPDTGNNSPNDPLRVFDINPLPANLSYEIGFGQLNNTPFAVPASGTEIATLGAHRNGTWTTEETRENLYKIAFEHHYLWLPISASNPSLSDASLSASDPAAVGLWVGEVIFDTVTNHTAPGSTPPPTTSRAPMRVILHVDATGATSLLSQVMLVQTKTADRSVAPEQILLLNEEKIPFYEGIEERSGKRVGHRIETVGYDMPRILSTSSQPDLLEEVAFANGYQNGSGDPDPTQVTDSDIVDYVNSLSTRSPRLIETYFLKWPLEGAPGSNEIVQTGSTPLVLDRFHRSNPFRHVFHPQHGTGRLISRDITMTFEGSGSSDTLQGRYSESITGLASRPIEMSGRLTLQRLNTVTTLIE